MEVPRDDRIAPYNHVMLPVQDIPPQEGVYVPPSNHHIQSGFQQIVNMEQPLSKRQKTNKGKFRDFTEEEDEILKYELTSVDVGDGGEVNWDVVAMAVGGDCTVQDCQLRWAMLNNSSSMPPDSSWTDAMDTFLREGVQRYSTVGGVDWDLVAAYIGFVRTSDQCMDRWARLSKPQGCNKHAPWSQDEDDLLIEAMGMYCKPGQGPGSRGCPDWSSIAQHMQGRRTKKQCSHRWDTLKHKRGGVKATPWTQEEDEALRVGVGLFEGQGKGGRVNWGKVAEHMSFTRSPQQCSHRWNNILKHRSPGLRTCPWTEEENERLREGVRLFEREAVGGLVDWNKVAEHMGGGRTPRQCNTRWNVTLKHRKQEVVSSMWTDEEDAKLREGMELYRGQGIGGLFTGGRYLNTWVVGELHSSAHIDGIRLLNQSWCKRGLRLRIYVCGKGWRLVELREMVEE